NPWLLEVHKSYKYLPKIENCRPEIDEKVLILNKNGKFSVPKKGTLTELEDYPHDGIISTTKRNYDVPIEKIYNSQITKECIFTNWIKTNEIKLNSKSIYENAKIKSRYNKKGEDDSNLRKCINDCNRLATPIDLIKNCTDIFTKS